MKKELPDGLIEKTKKWLRPEGIEYFRNIVKEHGEVNAVWFEEDETSEKGLKAIIENARGHSKIPHAVHFREGMQVRNFMRSSGLCDGFDDHDYDDTWVDLIERCIE